MNRPSPTLYSQPVPGYFGWNVLRHWMLVPPSCGSIPTSARSSFSASGPSPRGLAAAIGRSHRMLIDHFGSKEGLVVAVVQAVELAELEQLERLAADPDVPVSKGMRLMWKRFTDPAMWPHERLFFEVYSQALQGRPGTTGLLDRIIDSWVDPLTELAVARGVRPATARADARLAVALCRGLLLDLLATG